MPEVDPNEGAVSAATGTSPKTKKRKKDKVRSAWISFVGRIVAQMVGAAATIVLGVMFVQKYSDHMSKGPASDVAARQTISVQPNSDGRIVIELVVERAAAADSPSMTCPAPGVAKTAALNGYEFPRIGAGSQRELEDPPYALSNLAVRP
jgi:hypothetical protein